MGGEIVVVRTLAGKPQIGHLFPFCCLRRWEMGSAFFIHIKAGTLQYVVVKPVLAVITFILSNTRNYSDANFSLASGYFYVAFVTNASQIWAMYCLIYFYVVLNPI